ncbi:hypothetical protein [Haliangium ochraceum]|uniref:Uncharacterized protein n=1 Tax=Haliangium ochraceum (strain DSM 14365 / JCM 11303 / SMP-2) TaxID=502025 RepID=D0LIU6_HALO1|nr:hypothetical protein [Haliangium ochraceum]ACY12975.1 hypothetical protein Hoch_0334 [Haliangium ochraceum DSM 14365]
MKFFARAVISGFGFSVGKALFDKVKDHVGLGDSSSSTRPQGGVTQVDDIEDAEEDRTLGVATELETLDHAVH